jgi:phage FluMu gp28-like protein
MEKETQTPKEKPNKNIGTLIDMEWDIIARLYEKLNNPTSPNRYIDEIENVSPEQLYGTYYAGLDVDKQVDHSVLAVIQLTGKNEVRLVHKRQFPLGTPYPEVIAYTAKAHQTFNFDGMHVDKTGIGDAVVDELDNIEIPEVKGVFFTDAEKENILNYLKLLMEKKELRIRGDDRTLIAQINEQQYEYLKPNTAQERIHIKFRHPRGRHDDQLYALALACHASKEAEPEPTLTVIPR